MVLFSYLWCWLLPTVPKPCVFHWANNMQQYKNNRIIMVIFSWLILVTVAGATFV